MSAAFEKMKAAAVKLRDHANGGKKIVQQILEREADARGLRDVPETLFDQLTEAFQTKLRELGDEKKNERPETIMAKALRNAGYTAPEAEEEAGKLRNKRERDRDHKLRRLHSDFVDRFGEGKRDELYRSVLGDKVATAEDVPTLISKLEDALGHKSLPELPKLTPEELFALGRKCARENIEANVRSAEIYCPPNFPINPGDIPLKWRKHWEDGWKQEYKETLKPQTNKGTLENNDDIYTQMTFRAPEAQEQPRKVGMSRVFAAPYGLKPDGVIELAGKSLQDVCFKTAKNSGWHNDLATGQLRTKEQNDELFPKRLMLAVSELSEAMEGHRKSLRDDKLPHRDMAEVELADCIIRCFDLGGVMGYDLGAAIAEKLAFNAQREDHKVENRKKEGGKAY